MSNSKFIVEVDPNELPEILGICDEIGCTPSEYFLGLHRENKQQFLRFQKEKQEAEQKKRNKPKKDLH